MNEKESKQILDAMRSFWKRNPGASPEQLMAFNAALLEKSSRPVSSDMLEVFETWTSECWKYMQTRAHIFGVDKDCFTVIVREGVGSSFRVASGNPVVITFHGKPSTEVMGRALQAVKMYYDASNGLEKSPRVLEFDQSTRKLKRLPGVNPLSPESISESYNTLHPSEIEVSAVVSYVMKHKVTGETVTLESESDAPLISKNNWNYMAQRLTQRVVALHGPEHVDEQ